MHSTTPRSTLFPYTTLFRSRKRPRKIAIVANQARNRSKEAPMAQLAEKRETRPGASNEAAFNWEEDRKSTRLNSSHANISYAVFCLKKKTMTNLSTECIIKI